MLIFFINLKVMNKYSSNINRRMVIRGLNEASLHDDINHVIHTYVHNFSIIFQKNKLKKNKKKTTIYNILPMIDPLSGSLL